MLDERIFRAYDIRGKFGESFNKNTAYYIGKAFAVLNLSNNPRKDIYIGYDGRLSSAELLQGLVNGLINADVSVEITNIGLVATPMLYFADKTYAPAASIMITGSHNPKEDNGFKMLVAGQPFYGEQLQALRKLAVQLGTSIAVNDVAINNLPTIDISVNYVTNILKNIAVAKNLRIVWDNFNGSAGQALSTLVEHLPNQNIIINSQIDGNFPKHQPDPTVKANLSELIAIVTSENYDLGIAFDGDGDRISVVDNRGNFVAGDQLVAIFALYLAKKPNSMQTPVIFDIKASNILLNYLKQQGINTIVSPSGHTSIKKLIKETNAKLAGEMSGHIFFNDLYYGYDDALYAALRLIDLITTSQQSLHEHYMNLPTAASTPEIRLAVKDEQKFAMVQWIKQQVQVQPHNIIDDLDGISVKNNNGWWLLRASNTEAAITVRCEAANKAKLALLKKEVNNFLRPFDLSI